MKQKKKARPRGRLEHQLYPRYLTLPAFILFTVFFILPILGGVGISLTNWTVSRPSITRFVGLKNYITMFQDDDILLAFKNTAIFTVAIVILRNLFAILLALALVCGSLSGCASERQTAPAEPTVPFTDSLGRTVDIPETLTRVAPSGTVA